MSSPEGESQPDPRLSLPREADLRAEAAPAVQGLWGPAQPGVCHLLKVKVSDSHPGLGFSEQPWVWACRGLSWGMWWL